MYFNSLQRSRNNFQKQYDKYWYTDDAMLYDSLYNTDFIAREAKFYQTMLHQHEHQNYNQNQFNNKNYYIKM